MEQHTIQIKETCAGWVAEGGGTVVLFESAAHALASVREWGERCAPSILFIEWVPSTWIGRLVLRALDVDVEAREDQS